MHLRSTGWLITALGVLCSCRHTGDYVWARDFAAEGATDPAYLIAPGDVLAVKVWNDDGLGGRTRVRSDGKISLPFVDDVAAAGMAPRELARALETRLAGYVNAPRVTIALEEERLVTVSVLGEVAKPGVYDLVAGSGVLQALASAGGPTQWASGDRIFVLRRRPEGGPPVRIRFAQDALQHAEDASASFRLRRGDVVVVE